MTIMKSAAGKGYLALFIVISAMIGWFRYKNSLDAPAAFACAAAMLLAGVMIYETAQAMRHEPLTGFQFIVLTIVMVAAWYVMIFAANGFTSINFPSDSWSFWLLLGCVAISCAVQWWRRPRDITA